MMTFLEFYNELKKDGSDLSTWANKNLFGGVQSMPITHQTGFGYYWRRGIHPNDVDIDCMNDLIHVKMAAVGIGVAGSTTLIKSGVTAPGFIAAGLSIWGIMELYYDWQAGFEAAKHLNIAYWKRMHPEWFQTSVSSPFSMLRNHPSPGMLQQSQQRKLKRKRPLSHWE